MKKLQMVLVLAHTLTSLNAHAIAIEIKGPSKTGPKLTMSEEQLINAIKNERAPVVHDTVNFGLFDEANIEQLEELLQQRILQESGLVRLRDRNTLNNVLSFSALALQAWNPELRTANLKTQIARNIVNFGFMQGLVAPTMALIDLSYATGRPNFGNLLNVMLADITPSVAAGFESKYQIPTLINGQNFASISATGRNGMWQILTTQLGSDFFANHSLNFQGSNINDRINPMNLKNPSMDHFVDNTLRTENSYLNHYMKMIGHDNSSHFGSNTATMKKNNQEKINQLKGVFSNSSVSEPNSCQVKCLDEMIDRAVKYGEQFAKIGGIVGTAGGTAGGPPGMAAGAATGAAAGAVIGGGVGIAAGAYECAHSKQCGGDESSIKKENEKKEKELEQKEKQIKEQKEAQDKERAQLQKQQENIKKEKDEIKKQQDEVKKQQDEIRKQQEQIKKQQDDLKKQNDEKKQQEIKKQQIEMENKQKELKKKEDELKKREAELKKQEDDKKREEEENEKKKKQNEVEVGPKGKVKISDDEKSGNTAEENEKMKSSNSTPMVPAEDYVSTGSSFSKLDVIKVMQKEKTAPAKKVSVVYPVAPNGGE